MAKAGLISVNAEKAKRLRIKYIKHYFISEKGTVIKLAVMMSPFSEIIDKSTEKAFEGHDGVKHEFHISRFSVFSVENSLQPDSESDQHL